MGETMKDKDRVKNTGHWSDALRAVHACHESLVWALTQPDAATAWATCERADWLLWIAGRLASTDDARKLVVLAACACARTALGRVPVGEDRPRICIETAEAWARGEATIVQVRAARADALDARVEMWRKPAAAAADAAAAAAADAAAAAAYAADAAYAAAAAATAARADSIKTQADIVRGILSMPVMVMA
jgi:hypothetical protein